MKLTKLKEFDPHGSRLRYERALPLVNSTRIITQPYQPNQRFTVEVVNGFTSVVVLSHKHQSGYCSCMDFKKNGRICKHIFAAIMKINRGVVDAE